MYMSLAHAKMFMLRAECACHCCWTCFAGAQYAHMAHALFRFFPAMSEIWQKVGIVLEEHGMEKHTNTHVHIKSEGFPAWAQSAAAAARGDDLVNK